MLAMLSEIGVVKLRPTGDNDHSKATDGFQRYLLQERGLSPLTLHNYVPVVEQFLFERFRNNTPNVCLLCASDITKFVVRQSLSALIL
jgi:hypothetical protein